MELNHDTKSALPKTHLSKEFNTWSPRAKQLPSMVTPIDVSTKSHLDIVGIASPSGSTLGGRSYKAAPMRLIPLPIEGKGKENSMGSRRLQGLNQEPTVPSKFASKQHMTIIVHNRPVSEEYFKAGKSEKVGSKKSEANYPSWRERSFKQSSISGPVVIQEPELTCTSPKSKFKSKLLTARVTEEDIAKQFKKDKNNEGIFKEPITTNQLSRSSSLKKSSMSIYGELTLVRNSDLPSWQDSKQYLGSKTLDGTTESKVSPRISSIASDSLLLNSNKSSKKSQNSPPSKIKDSPQGDKGDSEKSRRKSSIEQTMPQQETVEVEQPQPRKLFQRKDVQVAGRGPMLFTKKLAANIFKPTIGLGLGHPSVSIAESPMKKVEDIPTDREHYTQEKEGNGDKEEGKQEKQQQVISNGAAAKRRISIKKEYFHGEIRGNILKWKMGDFIGSGNFGEVYRAMEVESGKIIAVKKISSANSHNKDFVSSFESELNILQKLKHKHIVQYLGHETFDNNLHIYLEYMSGGNITNILSKYGALPEKTVKVYAKQILAGLIYLHDNKVVHKDIKGANILVDGDGTVKLADFGCSSQFEKTLSNFNTFLANSFQGSIPWMAPEVAKETGYGRRSDTWSFGCTILEMATGKIPWSHYQYENHFAILMKIALSDEIPLIPDTLSEDLKDFLRLCLQRDPTKRPHAQDLIIHPFLTNN